MRISDWSADVCSSDLAAHGMRPDLLACRFDELTADNAWNQVLCSALAAVRPWIDNIADGRRWLELAQAFDEVTPCRDALSLVRALTPDRQARPYGRHALGGVDPAPAFTKCPRRADGGTRVLVRHESAVRVVGCQDHAARSADQGVTGCNSGAWPVPREGRAAWPPVDVPTQARTEERRVGRECHRTFNSRLAPAQ